MDEQGGYVVSLPDFPETCFSGKTQDHALRTATQGMKEAVCHCMRRGAPLPLPSHPGGGTPTLSLSAQMSAKAALYLALRESGWSKTKLAEHLHHDEKEIRRLLDPSHPSKLPRIEAALAVLGKRLVVEVRSIA